MHTWFDAQLDQKILDGICCCCMLVHLNLLCYYDCHTSLTDSAVAVWSWSGTNGSVYRDQSKRQIRSVCDCVVEKKAHSFTPHKLYADCLRWLQRLAITLKYCCCCRCRARPSSAHHSQWDRICFMSMNECRAIMVENWSMRVSAVT